MSSKPVTNNAVGDELSTTNRVLLAGASITQQFTPVQNICAHLNAFHAYASDPTRSVEANHYCGHVNNDVRQCIIYDSAEPGARIIGIEYMITPELYETLDPEERKLWHSHVYEVKSGMLFMPQARLPEAAWEVAENKEMEQVVKLYGKTFHLWQVDRGDKLPLGQPELMISYTEDGQLAEGILDERDAKFGIDRKKKKVGREYIGEPAIHPGKIKKHSAPKTRGPADDGVKDADQAWKKPTA